MSIKLIFARWHGAWNIKEEMKQNNETSSEQCRVMCGSSRFICSGVWICHWLQWMDLFTRHEKDMKQREEWLERIQVHAHFV